MTTNFITTFARKNLQLNKKRSLVTTLGILLSTALIVCVTAMGTSLHHTIKISAAQYLGNFHLRLSDPDHIAKLHADPHLRSQIQNPFIITTLGYAKLSSIESVPAPTSNPTSTSNPNSPASGTPTPNSPNMSTATPQSQEKSTTTPQSPLSQPSEIPSADPDRPFLRLLNFDSAALTNSGLTLSTGSLPKTPAEIIVPESLQLQSPEQFKIGATVEIPLGARTKDHHPVDPNSKPAPNEHFQVATVKFFTITGTFTSLSHYVENYNTPYFSVITTATPQTAVTAAPSQSPTSDQTAPSTTPHSSSDLSTTTQQNKKWSTPTIQYPQTQLFFYSLKHPKSLPTHAKALDPNLDLREIGYYDKKITANLNLLELEGADPTGRKSNDIKILASLVGIVLLTIMLTSAYVIRNSFAISATEQVRQYGILKSLGATNRQVQFAVFQEGFTLAVFGVFFGVLLGLLANYILVFLVNHLLHDFFSPGFSGLLAHPSLNGILLSVALSFLTVFGSTFFIARKVKKIPPISAIRSTTDIKINTKKLRTPWLIRQIFGIGGTLSHKNLKRNRKKYRTTVISLTLSIAIFISMNFFVNILTRSLQIQSGQTNFNLQLTFNTEETPKITTALDYISTQILRNQPHTISSIHYAKSPLDHFTTDFQNHLQFSNYPGATPPGAEPTQPAVTSIHTSIITLDDTSFARLLQDNHLDKNTTSVAMKDFSYTKDGKIFLRPLFKTPKLSTTITIHEEPQLTPDSPESSSDPQPSDSQSSNSTQPSDPASTSTTQTSSEMSTATQENQEKSTTTTQSTPSQKDPENPKIAPPKFRSFPVEFDLALADTPPIGYSQSSDSHSVYIFVPATKFFAAHPDLPRPKYRILHAHAKNDHEVTKTIKQYLTSSNITNFYLMNLTDQLRLINNLLLLIQIFGYGFIAVITLIGLTNVFNTINTNILLRRREFAALRSIGMTTKEFNRMIALESLFYGTKSLLLGIPIGLALTALIHRTLGEKVHLPYDPPLLAILLSVIFIFLVVHLIMRYSVKSLSKQNLITIIRNENL